MSKLEKNQRKSGVILSYLSIAINMLTQLIYIPVLIKYMGQSEYGLYSLAASVIGYLTVLDLGFGNAIIVHTSKYRAQGDKKSEQKLHGMFFVIFLIIGALAALIGIALFFVAPFIFEGSLLQEEIDKLKVMLLILALNLFITFAFNIYSCIISAYEKFAVQKIIAIVGTLLKPLVMIPLLIAGYRSIAMVIVLTAVNILICISNYIYCKKRLHIKIRFMGFDKKLFRKIFSYSFFIFLGVIVDKINWSVDQFILGATSGTVAVSIYSVASQLNSLFVNLSTAISGVLLPKISQMVAVHTPIEKIDSEFRKVGRLQCFIIFFMASCFILFGKEFIRLWVGDGFEESYFAALLLILPVCIPLIQNLALSITQAMNKHKFRAIITSIMAVFNVGISIVLARRFGAVGAAAGTAIAMVLCNGLALNIYYAKSVRLNIKAFWLEIMRMTAKLSLPFLITLAATYILDLRGVTALCFYGIFYAILYFTICYSFVMNTYEKETFKNLFHLRKKRTR